MKNKQKNLTDTILITLVVVLVVIIVGYIIFNRSNTTSIFGDKNISNLSNNQNQQNSKIPAEILNQTEVSQGSFLNTNSIKLISPKDSQEFVSGSKITVEYELNAIVKSGVIRIGGSDSCAHMINEQENVGMHSFECTLPKQVGSLKIEVNEISFYPKINNENVIGQIILITGNTLTVKDIEYYPKKIIIMANPQGKQSGYVDFSVVYSDGTNMKVDASNFNINITDSSIVSVLGSPNGSKIYLTGNGIGNTEMTVIYQGIKKIIPITVFPNDNSIR